MSCYKPDGTPKKRSKWNKCGESRVSPVKYVAEDRVATRNVGPKGGPYVRLPDRDTDDVTEQVWVDRRKEGAGWKNGARVSKRS